MENRGKDGYRSQWDIFHLKDEFHRIYRPFEILKLQARKSVRSSYTFALLLSTSCEVTRRSHDHNAFWLEEIKPHSIGCQVWEHNYNGRHNYNATDGYR